MEACAFNLQLVTLEIGGNNAAIVCPDVDIAAVVPKAFLTAFVEFVKNLKSGGPAEAEAVLGPSQNIMQYGKLLDKYNDISKKDLKAAFGGEPSSPKTGSGFFLPPTVVENPHDSRVVIDEQLGPILPLFKWSGKEDYCDAPTRPLWE
ncbi:hypothetical protein VSDG_02976 [Cytospora chrysosperma]|uniref:aldehyde dehydrogenase (NAD(+)) n=1 Tax=Cytospora chrysosperma TaxID=252740 RepID=A0A423W8M5_CYTCH|nr:hypothetical protein VSDG_02976 [Valsa sordida]